MAHDAHQLDLQAPISLADARRRAARGATRRRRAGSSGDRITLKTTLGRALFNEALPEDYPFVDKAVDKKELSAIVNDLAERYPKVQVAATLDALKAAGFHWATRSGVTISSRTSSPRRPSRASWSATRDGPRRSRASTSAA